MEENEVSESDLMHARVERLIEAYYPPSLQDGSSLFVIPVKILRALVSSGEEGLSRSELVEATGLEPMQISNALKKFRTKLYKFSEFGLVFSTEGKARFTRSVLSLGDPHNEGQFEVDVRISKNIVDDTQHQLAERIGHLVGVSSVPPANAEALLNNATWVLHAETGRLEIAKRALSAGRGGRSVNTLAAKRILSQLGYEVSDNLFHNLFRATYTNALELGFVIRNFSPAFRGCFGILWLDNQSRITALHKKYPKVDIKYEKPFLQDAREYSDDSMSELFDAHRGLLAPEEEAIVSTVFAARRAGVYPSLNFVSAKTGLSIGKIRKCISEILIKSHDTNFFLKTRTTPGGLEIVLTKA